MSRVAVTYSCQRLGEIIGTASDLVGVAGFEPTAPRSQSECATKLRHTPMHLSGAGRSLRDRQHVPRRATAHAPQNETRSR